MIRALLLLLLLATELTHDTTTSTCSRDVVERSRKIHSAEVEGAFLSRNVSEKQKARAQVYYLHES